MKQRKYSQVRISYEMLHTFLGFNESVHIDFVRSDDNTHVVCIHVSSDAEVLPQAPSTHLHGEFQQIPVEVIDIDDVIENMRKTIHQYDERKASESEEDQSREIDRLYMQLRNSHTDN